MAWIEAHTEWALALMGIGAAALGYYWRLWNERRNTMREALFLLMEIWHRSYRLGPQDTASLICLIAERLPSLLPGAVITSEQKVQLAAHFGPVLLDIQRKLSGIGIESLRSSFDTLVSQVSRFDPLLAYDLESSATAKRLAYLDQYLESADAPAANSKGAAEGLSQQLRRSVMRRIEDEVVLDLERHIGVLARRLSPITWLGVAERIRRRKRGMRAIAEAEIDRIIANDLLPIIEAAQATANQPASQSEAAPLARSSL